MKCLQCGREIQEDSRFCVYCGQKVSQREYDQEIKTYQESLKKLEKEQAELEKKKEEMIQKKKDLKLNLDNYIRLQKGEYEECHRWKSAPAEDGTARQQQTEKAAKQTNIKILFLVFNFICCGSVFLSWVKVPLFAQIMDYAGVDYSLNILNMVRVLPFLEEGIREGGGTLSELCTVLMMDLILFLILMIILIGIHIWCISVILKNNAELYMHQNMRTASLYGIACGTGVWFIGFCTNVWLQNNIGDYYEYVGMSLKTDVGVWLVFVVSIAGYICAKIIYNEDAVEKKEDNCTALEITNYDPVLPFRAIRLLISQRSSFTGYSFTGSLKVMSFLHRTIDRVEAEIHVITNRGQKFVIPAMTFLRSESSKGDEVVLNGQLYGKQLDCNFNDLREAKLYVRQYNTDTVDLCTEQETVKESSFLETLEEGSGFSVDSDFIIGDLKVLRRQYGDSYMKREGSRGECWMCSCGQIYDRKLKNCPLCGKERQEEVD